MGSKAQQWQGLVSSQLQEIKPDQAGFMLGDSCSLHKLMPSITTCRRMRERRPRLCPLRRGRTGLGDCGGALGKGRAQQDGSSQTVL